MVIDNTIINRWRRVVENHLKDIMNPLSRGSTPVQCIHDSRHHRVCMYGFTCSLYHPEGRESEGGRVEKEESCKMDMYGCHKHTH